MTATTNEATGGARVVLVVGADRDTFGLLGEWLAGDGWRVTETAQPGDELALALIDVPYPRHGGVRHLHDVLQAHPDVPVIALSPTFFGSVLCTGECTQALGVAGVLPKPVSRQALIDGVRSLARR